MAKTRNVCSHCNKAVPRSARFCPSCGTRLGEEPGQDRVVEVSGDAGDRIEQLGVTLTPQHRRRLEEFLSAPEQQNRSATVLFIDISGYTRICERLRGGKVKELLDVYYGVCARMVDFFNGFVLEFQGDGCLAVFGAPVAYDRDAESAVRAAIEIRKRVRAFPEMHGEKIIISAGIETGEVLSSVIRDRTPPQFKVFGASVNLAARIQGKAKPDTILVGPNTYDLVKDVFEARTFAPRRMKNVSTPVVTHEILRCRREEIVRRDFGVGFVGRTREMNKLRQVWTNFAASFKSPGASSSAVIITGEPGIGKTRLTMEFLRTLGPANALTLPSGRKAAGGGTRHRDGARTVAPANVICIDGAPYAMKIPWELWRTVLAVMGGGTADDPPQAVTRGFKTLTVSLRLPVSEQECCFALLGLPEMQKKFASVPAGNLKRQFAAALRNLFEKLGRELPLVLVLDDLQWSDSTSLDILDQLVADPPRGVFFMLLRRSGFELKGTGFRQLQEVHLHFLDERSRESLFNLLANMQKLGPEVRDLLAQQAEGNPYYIMELVRALTRTPGTGKRASHPGQVLRRIEKLVPLSLREILQSRIDLLDEQRKLVLQCGAILGNRFAYQLIQLFDFLRKGLLARLYSLESLELLEDEVTQEGLEFVFHHHVTREVAYQMVDDRKRHELHTAVANRIETDFAQQLDFYAPILAYHYGQAENHQNAVHYLTVSGRRATSMAAPKEALMHYNEALAHLLQWKDIHAKKRDSLLATLLTEKARMELLTGHPKLAMNSLRRAIQVAEKHDLHMQRALARLQMGIVHIDTSHYDRAEKELKAALEAAPRSRDKVFLGKVWNNLGICEWGRGNYRKAREWYEKVRDLDVQESDPATMSDAVHNLALVSWREGNLRYAAELFRKSIELSRGIGDKVGVAVAFNNIGIVQENMGHYATAEKQYGEALQLARQIHYPRLENAVYANMGNLCLARERHSEALAHSERALDIARSIGDRRSVAIALENMALAHVGQRQFADSRKHIRAAQRIARAIGDKERSFSLKLAEIECELEARPVAVYAARLQKAQAELEKSGFDAELPRVLRLLTLAYSRTGAAQKARDTGKRAIAAARSQCNKTEENRARKLL